MANIFKEFMAISNELDTQNCMNLADEVDKIAQDVRIMKYAQFVGVQGPWMKNTRCWKNCYRQKRAKNQDKSAQEVWSECHSEYVDYINGNNEEWNKYAEREEKEKKFSSKFAEKITEQENKIFHENLKKNLDAGMSHGMAFVLARNASFDRYYDQFIETSEKMASLADRANEKGLTKIAKKLSYMSEELVKEAAWWDNLKNWFRGEGRYYQQAVNVLERKYIPVLSRYLQSLKKFSQAQLDQRSRQQLRATLQSIYNYAKQLENFSGQFLDWSSGFGNRQMNALAQNMFNTALDLQTYVRTTNPAQYNETVDQQIAQIQGLAKQLDQVDNQVDQVQEQVQEQAQQVQPQQEQERAESVRLNNVPNTDQLALRNIKGYLQNILQNEDLGFGLKGAIHQVLKYLQSVPQRKAREQENAQQMQQNWEPTNPYQQMGIQTSSEKNIKSGGKKISNYFTI